MHGSKRQGITPFASLNTAFATRTAPSSHWQRASASAITFIGPSRPTGHHRPFAGRTFFDAAANALAPP